MTHFAHGACPIPSQDDGSLLVITGKSMPIECLIKTQRLLSSPRQYQDAHVLGGRSKVRAPCGHLKATDRRQLDGLYDHFYSNILGSSWEIKPCAEILNAWIMIHDDQLLRGRPRSERSGTRARYTIILLCSVFLAILGSKQYSTVQ